MSADRLDTAFDEVCRRHGDRIAVVDSSAALSYAELRRRADLLAARLRAAGAAPERFVGLYAVPGVDLIVGILAIVKSGAGYLVLDPAYPAARLSYLLEDCRPVAVLAAGAVPALIAEFGVPVLALDSGQSTPPPATPAAPVSETDPAYVIYTSGTTGQPKGVVVEHRNVLRLFSSTRHWFGFSAEDVWTLFHSASFDFSVWEIWGALLFGGKLVVVSQAARRHPGALLRVLADHQVTVLNQTPSAFRQLASADDTEPGVLPESLRLVVFGGERLDLDVVTPFMRRHPAIELVNMYGITETTVHVTYRRLTPADLSGPPVSPIGVPIPDLTVRLLDAAGNPVPDNTAGEIWVGGAGVARGYHNRPELNAERFVRHRSGSVWYRSGDRAVLRSGELHYLGRADDQVKVNGFRIEPAEVEAALRGHPDVAGAVVTTGIGQYGAVELVALVVPAGPLGADPVPAWRRYLLGELPAHMRPGKYFVVDRITLTSNGKLDRPAAAATARQLLRQLYPDVEESPVNDPDHTRTVLEPKVAAAAFGALSQTEIGLEEDLFDLGLTSLGFVRIMSELNAEFGTSLNGSELPGIASVRSIAEAIAHATTVTA